MHRYWIPWLRAGTAAAWVLLAGAVFYLSWLPQPQLGGQVPMPGFLSAWVDAGTNQNLRTAVPFLMLGLAAGAGLWARDAPWPQWIFQGLMMVAIAVVAEAGQLLIPARTCDAGDIVWAAAGAAMGLGAARLGGKAIQVAAGHWRRSAG